MPRPLCILDVTADPSNLVRARRKVLAVVIIIPILMAAFTICLFFAVAAVTTNHQ